MPFIVFEGIDGCGKSTQLRLAEEALKARGLPVVVSRQPSTRKIGSLIREMAYEEMNPVTEFLLFSADIYDSSASVIEPALQRGDVVLSDRYSLSSIAYSFHALREALASSPNARTAFNTPESMLRMLTEATAKPDLTLYLRLPISVALDRLKERGRPPDRNEQPDNLAVVLSRYEAELERSNRAVNYLPWHPKITEVDALLPVSELHAVIMRHIEKVLR